MGEVKGSAVLKKINLLESEGVKVEDGRIVDFDNVRVL
jgi:hypothetical protein